MNRRVGPTVMLLSLLLLLPAPAIAVSVADGAAPAQGVAQIRAQLEKERDQADPALVEALAEAGTREALEALIASYELMSSVLMRREIVLALASFDGVADCEQAALQKVADVATLQAEPELHAAAIDALAGSPSLGPHFLRLIVDSPAEDMVRVRAMRALVALEGSDDVTWYRQLFDKPRQQDDKELKRALKSGEQVVRIDTLTEIRELCFRQIAPTLEEGELIEFAREKERDQTDLRKEGIRRLALEELGRRGSKRLEKLAQQVFEDKTEKSANRAVAARMLAALRGDKVFAEFVAEGLNDPSVTPPELSATLCELARSLRTHKDDKKLIKELDKARPHQQVFLFGVLRGATDEKLIEAAGEAMSGSDRDAAIAAAQLLGASGRPEALPLLESALRASPIQAVATASLAALGGLRADDPAWTGELRALAADSKREVRNAALSELVRLEPRAHQDVLIAALESDDWSTRAVALRGLEAARTREAVGAIVACMESQQGLPLNRFADTLWRLTGQPFRTSPRAWKAWWEKEGPGFEPISPGELATLEREEERRRLAQTTKASSFFGIRVISQRVIFVLDVSGSMAERLRAEHLGEAGPTRAERAREELERCIDSLEPGALFNLILFSDDVSRWIDGGVSDSRQAAREEAKAFLRRVGSGGGTNLYAAMRAAFSDPDVDTIIVLSDGEPSRGDLVEPWELRREIQTWNDQRGVVIHTISVGGDLPVLRWLAEDSGGNFTAFQ